MLQTERLVLRPFRDDDLDLYAALNADPEVMQFLMGIKSREDIVAEIGRLKETTKDGYGFLCVEIPGETTCAGFIGLMKPRWSAHFTPCVEIGWRLARKYWGQGYAIEGARASLAHGFGTLGLKEIVALTVPANLRSRSVMERLNMRRDEDDDFDHPQVPEGHPHRRHVLYRIQR